MKLELMGMHLSTLIDVLEDVKKKNGDLEVGFEDNDSYTNKCIVKTIESGEFIFDISK